MKRFAIVGFLLLSACASAPKPAPVQMPKLTPVEQAVADNGVHGILALMVVQGLDAKMSETAKNSFALNAYSRLDQATAVKIVAFVLKRTIKDKDADNINLFLMSPAGKAGLAKLSRLMIAGQAEKKSELTESDPEWKGFAQTESGSKLLGEGSNMQKEIAALVVQAGKDKVKSSLPGVLQF